MSGYRRRRRPQLLSGYRRRFRLQHYCTGVKCYSVSITHISFIVWWTHTQKQARHVSLCAPIVNHGLFRQCIQSINQFRLGKTRIWETLKNVTPAIKRSRLIFQDFWAYSDLDQILPVFKTKGHPSDIHSKSQWMSMANPKSRRPATFFPPTGKDSNLHSLSTEADVRKAQGWASSEL
jgi:hypothetical protein